MATVPITLALASYDRHVPFLDGSIQIPGFDLHALEVGQSAEGRHGQDRHRRMLESGEFDVAEVSFSNYLMALDRDAPFTAIPIVPRRLFSQSLFFTRIDSPLSGPESLVGRRVGLNTYQTTLSVLAKGDLAALPRRPVEGDHLGHQPRRDHPVRPAGGRPDRTARPEGAGGSTSSSSTARSTRC